MGSSQRPRPADGSSQKSGLTENMNKNGKPWYRGRFVWKIAVLELVLNCYNDCILWGDVFFIPSHAKKDVQGQGITGTKEFTL